MSQYGISIRELIEDNPIQSSAPCRIDAGGTWDIKAMALPLEGLNPVTVNMALNLRTYVSLLPFKSGWVKVSSEGYPHQEAYPLIEAPLVSTFGLFFAIALHYKMHGVEIIIRSTSPVNAGLGGSSTASVATIKAFSRIKTLLYKDEIEREDILHLAYHLEDAIRRGGCGMQDQGAAVFGGVQRWSWNYSREGRVFERETIVGRKGYRDMSQRILVAFSGKRHNSAAINRRWLEECLRGRTRPGWIEANRIVNRLASHMGAGRWEEAAGSLRDEVAIRREITPEAFTPIIDRLIRESEEIGCGARFAGAGGGGSVWALGEVDAIERLREVWEKVLKSARKGRILDCAIDPDGVRGEEAQENERGIKND